MNERKPRHDVGCAIKLLKAGKKVRIATWKPGLYLWFDEECGAVCESLNPLQWWSPSMNELLSEEWVEATERTDGPPERDVPFEGAYGTGKERRKRHKTIMTQLTEDQQRLLSSHVNSTSMGPVVIPPQPPISLPAPEAFRVGRIAAIVIDGLGVVSVTGEPFLSDLNQDDAARLIKAIARHTDLHPDAIADFLDDLTEGMDP